MISPPAVPSDPPRRLRHNIVTRFVLAAAAAAILGSVMSGCSTGTGTSTSTSTQGTSTATPPSQPPRSTAPSLPTAAQLKSALLSSGDLGTGFATESTGSGTSSVTGCQGIADLLNGTARNRQTEQETSLAAGQTGPFVDEVLMTEPAQALSQDYARDQTTLTTCRTLAVSDGSTTISLALSPIHFGGPGATSVQLDGTLDGVEVNGYITVDRLGSVELGLIYFQIASGSSQLASYYVTLAVAKARSALGPLASPLATS